MVLVTGGAGYIGAHTTYRLIELGHRVVIIDDFSTGKKANLHPEAEFYQGDFADLDLLSNVFNKYQIEAVFHFAASLSVHESVKNPQKYFTNNTEKSQRLIDFLISHEVKYFIFSSTCAVYGNPKTNPVTEESELAPLSPYGESKVLTEKYLKSNHIPSKFKYAILRYFNVAGAREDGSLNLSVINDHNHLINIASEVALGLKAKLEVFGNKYSTPDGTCLRDYMHINDLVEAHISALEYLKNGGASNVFNCSYGKGFSVLEVINSIQKITGKFLKYQISTPRSGDSPAIFGNSQKLKHLTGWSPRFDKIDLICTSVLKALKK